MGFHRIFLGKNQLKAFISYLGRKPIADSCRFFFLTTNMAIQSCRLFYTFEDTSTEYKLQKIKYDELEFDKLVSIWSDDLDEKLTCVGFIGEVTTLLIGCQHFLELTTEQTDSLLNLIREQISLVSECLLAYRKLQKIAFIYCSNNAIFQEKSLHLNVVSIILFI